MPPLQNKRSPGTFAYCPIFEPMTEYYKIGKLVATFGLGGELVMKHSFGKKTLLKGLTTLFTEEKNGSFLPWFIEATRLKNEEELFIKIENVTTKEAAAKLTQKEVWLPEADVKKYSAATAPMALLGYTVIEDGQPLGTVLEVIEQPHQVLCRIEYKGKEALIPLHAETLLKLDKKKAQVTVQLPPGLLEIYR